MGSDLHEAEAKAMLRARIRYERLATYAQRMLELLREIGKGGCGYHYECFPGCQHDKIRALLAEIDG